MLLGKFTILFLKIKAEKVDMCIILRYSYTDRRFVSVRSKKMPRNKYLEETVKLILDTAARLFTEKGFEKTSLQDIMNETKLSKGAIYHHFASKEDIFIKICANTSKRTEQLLSKVRDDKRLNGREKLKKIYAEALGNAVNNEIVPMQPYMISNHKFLAA